MSLKARFKAARHRLKARMTGWRMSILAGPLKDYRWCVVTGTRYLRGRHGADEAGLLRQHLKPGGVMYDIGAHVGYVALLASRIAGAQGRVYAFEPLPLNRRFIEAHIRANQVKNVELLPFAVCDRVGERMFDAGGGTGRGHLGESGLLRVPTVNLDALIAEGGLPPPDLVKMDVEGAEAAALSGALGLLREHRPTILLSTHGEAVKRECERLLESCGYELTYYSERDCLATARRTLAALLAFIGSLATDGVLVTAATL